jgi:ABC transport system ATP-binding/permease protein
MNPESVQAPAGSALIVRTPDAERSLSSGRTYFVGRDPQSDIVVNDARVSWRHAALRQDGTTWLFEDVGSTNGTFQGRTRVQRVTISDTCAIRLGHPDDGPAVSLSVSATAIAGDGATPAAPPPTRYVRAPGQPPAPQAAAPAPPQAQPAAAPPAGPGVAGAAPPGGGYRGADGAGGPAVPSQRMSLERMPSAVLRLPTTLLRIGRATDNQVVVSDLSVSRYHAELRRDTGGGYSIVDLGSHNGTFVNGQRVGSAPVTERDVISIGPATFRLVGEELQEFLDTGDISFIAKDLTVALASGKVLLDHVSFPLGERCLMGVIGPSGAGKSTLLGALTGIRPATQGSVLYDDRDLYAHYAELRYRIGLVPQQDILHTQLTAKRALGYAAELRFPKDVSPAERSHRIDEVLGELALTRHADTKIDALSGGQRKRVNVATELLTKPSLLFLDEPTSGLDPGLDKSVMEQMAELAHDGRTIIVVTHSVANLDLCDRLLVLVPGGKIAYFGAPRDGLKHFSKPGWAEVFQAFEAEPDRDWAGEFRNSAYYAQFVAAGMEPAGAVHAQGQRPAAPPPPKSRNRFSQLGTLARRNIAVMAAQPLFVGGALAISAVLGGLFHLFPAAHGFTMAGAKVAGIGPNPAAQSLLLILTLTLAFIGGIFALGEIVNEREIYARERAAGLSAGAYLASKLLVLGVFGVLMAEFLVVGALILRPFPPAGVFSGSVIGNPLLEIAVAMAGVVVVSIAISLFCSASVNTREKTLPLFLLVFVLQVVVTGGIFPVHGKVGLEQVAWFLPSRWGFGASAATVDLPHIVGSPAALADPVWRHTAHAWVFDVGAMVALFVGYALLTWWQLLRKDPGRRK